MGIEGLSNQMLLFQASKSPIINNLLVTLQAASNAALFSLEAVAWRVRGGGWWRMAGSGEVREAESIGAYNRISVESMRLWWGRRIYSQGAGCVCGGRNAGPYLCITWHVDEQGISHLKLFPGINILSQNLQDCYRLPSLEKLKTKTVSLAECGSQ